MNPSDQSTPGACYKFTVSSAEEAAAIIRDRLGPEARVLSVRNVESTGLSRFFSKPRLEVVAQIGLPEAGPGPAVEDDAAVFSEDLELPNERVLEDEPMDEPMVAVAGGGPESVPAAKVEFPDDPLAALEAGSAPIAAAGPNTLRSLYASGAKSYSEPAALLSGSGADEEPVRASRTMGGAAAAEALLRARALPPSRSGVSEPAQHAAEVRARRLTPQGAGRVFPPTEAEFAVAGSPAPSTALGPDAGRPLARANGSHGEEAAYPSGDVATGRRNVRSSQSRPATASAAGSSSSKNLAGDRTPSQRPGQVPARLRSTSNDLATLLRRSGLSDVALGRLQAAPFWAELASQPLHRALVDVGAQIRRQAEDRWSGPSLRRAAFIGTAGSGRTTALCKWLALEVFRRARSGHVITAEFDRPHAPGALPVFAEALGVPVARFPAATEPVTPEGFVYFDLPGLSLREPASNRPISQFLDTEKITERVLILNAAYDHAVLRSTYAVARDLGATHVVFTHLDEIPQWGRLWDHLFDGALEPLFLGTGPSLTGDCEEDVFGALVRRTLAPMETASS